MYTEVLTDESSTKTCYNYYKTMVQNYQLNKKTGNNLDSQLESRIRMLKYVNKQVKFLTI